MFENKEEMEKFLEQDMCDDPELISETDQCDGIDYVFDENGMVIETIEVKGDGKADR